MTHADFASLCWLCQAASSRMDCFVTKGMPLLNRYAIYCREWLPSSHRLPTVSSCTRAGKRLAYSPSCHPKRQSSESLELPTRWTACCSSMPSALHRHQHSKGLQLMLLQALSVQAMVTNMTVAVLVYAMEGWCCVWWEESCQRASTSVMASAGESPAIVHEDLDVEYGAFLSKAYIVALLYVNSACSWMHLTKTMATFVLSFMSHCCVGLPITSLSVLVQSQWACADYATCR